MSAGAASFPVRGPCAALVALMLAACGNADVVSMSAAGTGSVAMTSDGGGSGDDGFRNPFNGGGAQPITGRQVIANPTLAEVMQPSSSLTEIAVGRPDAPVTIIKYASMTCPYCAKFQREVFPELKRQYIDTGKVRLVIREFPIGFQSGAATIALRCAPADKQLALYDKLMAQQSAWVSQEVRHEPILKVASQVGLTRQQYDACREDKALVAELNKVKERGRTLGIVGTPNFFINGKLIKSELSLPALKSIVDPLIAAGPAAQKA